MSQRQFDIAVIGNTLSARMSATLLAKNGLSVIRFGSTEPDRTGWLFSSLFLEKLLGALGGRSCFTNPTPIQVISVHSRVSIHQETSIETELTREFDNDGPALIEFLNSLLETGSNLNALLWDNNGLPWPGLKSQGLFRYHCLRRKLSTRELNGPLTEQLNGFPLACREFLINLFQGLSLLPIGNLTLVDAALLWTQANRPENLAEEEFNKLLEKRFEQFHGRSEPLEQLERVELQDNEFVSGRIKERGEFQAKALLIGDLYAVSQFPSIQTVSPVPATSTTRLMTSDLSNQLSPLLAERVIVGNQQPLRVAFQEEDGQTVGAIDAGGSQQAPEITTAMEPVLPFATYSLNAAESSILPDSTRAQPSSTGSLFTRPIQLGRNLFCVDSSLLYPGMPAAGGALIAWSLLNRFGRSETEGKSR